MGRLIWCDLETFGLDYDHDPIIEIGFAITDLDFNVQETFSRTIWDEVLYGRRLGQIKSNAAFDDNAHFILKMHTDSGLFEEAMKDGNSLYDVLNETLAWLTKQGVDNEEPFCGSSPHFDRAMLLAQMPEVIEKFHYRNIDVSSVKGLCERLNPEMYSYLKEDVVQQKLHRVIPDLHDTLNEMKWYRDNFLITETYGE